MAKKKLVPFNCASLDYCPECGATGNYGLLVARLKNIERAFSRSGPGRVRDREVHAAIQDALEVVGKDEK